MFTVKEALFLARKHSNLLNKIYPLYLFQMSGRKEKSREMDLLKSILDTDANQNDDPDHVVLSLPGRRSPRRHKSPRARARTISSDTDTSTLDGDERWAKRTKNKRINSAKRHQHVVTHREMLDNKYLELRQLLYDQFRKNKFRLDPHLVARAKELMRRYQMAQDGHLPIEAVLGVGQKKEGEWWNGNGGILTRCGPVTPYGDTAVGQHWLKQWLVA